MKRNLKAVLADRLRLEELELLYRSYDVIGDIAIIRIPDALKHRSKAIAEAIMQIQKHVKTVLRQVSPVSGDLRLRRVEWVVGEKKVESLHKEHGCLFKIAHERCYFSPRLSHERMRISQQVQSGEVIVNMFSGVGCYSIMIAKHSAVEKVYSIDINPVAVRYMQENVKLNKVGGRVIPIEGDAKNIIQESLQNVADRVLMPLPERAYEYLGYAVQALKQKGGWIHYYDFEHARKDESSVEKVKVKVVERLQNLGVDSEIPFGRIVRTTGPNWYQVALDVHLTNLL
ncbi:MAG: class I SAM-dependent methyltransferase family protein [Candidatus Bathyarchaeota archaeon]|nr:MAG: class I SAM-dependent methyltransferase family protein [Candidatus Bathyarchaeota archaeon]